MYQGVSAKAAKHRKHTDNHPDCMGNALHLFFSSLERSFWPALTNCPFVP